MGLFDFIADDMAGIPDAVEDPPVCQACKEDGEYVEGEPAESWQPGVVVKVWRCPKCGHETVRGDHDNETFV